MLPSYQPRIEVYEDGRNVPVAPHPPVLSSAFLGQDVILERHLTLQSAHYGEREHPTHILFLYEGEPVRAAWRVGGQRFDAWVHSGHLWIVPPSIPHTSSFQGPHGGVLLSIGKSQLERHIGPLMRGGRIELAPGFNLEDAQLEHLLRALLAVAQDVSGADALIGELLVNAACMHLAKRYAVTKLNLVPRRGGLPAARLKRVLEYIDANLGKNITLSELAGLVNMSLYYFAVLFRQSTGQSPHRYVLNQRVERAKELLRDPKLSVLDISIDVGFEHQNNFARAFRRVIGVSPTQFRRDRL
ncbi:MAG TPA: AraC family transcriptional regulator [Candidatus Dormibacteraeota bacterium]|nr:AraC family transcriptional regulator [Candidatus Dormibacteraeota bacterium]